MLAVTGTVTVIAREVWGYVTVCGERRGRAGQSSGVRFDGCSVVVFWWIVLYCVDMWNIKKESSLKQENLFQTVAQSKIQNKFHSQTQEGSQNLLHISIKQIQTRLIQILRIYRGRWLGRWSGLHYTTIWDKRFCIAEIIYKQISEMFCGGDSSERLSGSSQRPLPTQHTSNSQSNIHSLSWIQTYDCSKKELQPTP
jgi:hypothetical protein